MRHLILARKQVVKNLRVLQNEPPVGLLLLTAGTVRGDLVQ